MSNYENNQLLAGLSLGKETEYRARYNPDLLQAVPRSLNREALELVPNFQFIGCDVWHAYELSWLNSKGKPVVALARLSVDANSPNIIESKSLKLYLNSLNQMSFDSSEAVCQLLIDDLSQVAGCKVDVSLIQPDDLHSLATQQLPGDCLDGLDISIDDFKLEPELLKCESNANSVKEILHSHLLKSNCLITDQPDWASVVIDYQGDKIDRESLLRYLISFRLHNEFHEQCVERIFTDIMRYCEPNSLSVQALYTRRGGLDINPYRTTDPQSNVPFYRINRQ